MTGAQRVAQIVGIGLMILGLTLDNDLQGRNVIERGFNTIKHWRGLATRYDKHAVVFRGALVLAATLHWLADLGDAS